MKTVWHGLIYQGKNYSDKFEVSNLGRLRNIKTGNILKLNIVGRGYLGTCVSLGSRKNILMVKIHKAVAESFISNPENKREVNHKDCNKLNNKLNNLEWATPSENMCHAYKNNLMNLRTGENHRDSKLTQNNVEEIRNSYIPYDKNFGTRGLARKFGVTHGTIRMVLSGKTWKQTK